MRKLSDSGFKMPKMNQTPLKDHHNDAMNDENPVESPEGRLSDQKRKKSLKPNAEPFKQDGDSFCEQFVIYGLNHKKYINDRIKSYEILSSFPDIKDNPKVAEDNNYVQNLDFICFPQIKCNVESFSFE